MSDSDPFSMTIGDLARLIESKAISPVEVTAKQLARIETLDGRLKSYATMMADQAMAAAKAAESEIAEGRYRGPLHGMPVAVKDLCYTQGVRTMGGSRVFANHIPTFDATVVERLQTAGAVLLGKLNLTEGAMANYHPEFDIPVNPWRSDVWSGVSSSGSGVAVAAGLCFGALGSDTGGSIRFPSAACGVVGLKPTWGRVSRYGVMPLAESMDHVGPMARSVADVAIVLQAIAGVDPNDPTSLPGPAPDILGGIERGVAGVRIGFDEQYATKDVDAELAEAVLDGVRVLEGLGAEIVEVHLPELDDYLPAWPVLLSVEIAAAHESTFPARREEYGPALREWLDIGAGVSGVDYAKANNLRAACTGRIREVFEAIDVLACPSMQAPPHPVRPADLYGPLRRDPDVSSRNHRFMRFTVPYDFNGAPTLSMPCGINREGLPLSLQLVAHHLDEALLCRVGHAYEQATEWHTKRPPIE